MRGHPQELMTVRVVLAVVLWVGYGLLAQAFSISEKGPLSCPKPQPLQKTNSTPDLILHSPGNLFFFIIESFFLMFIYLFIFVCAGSCCCEGSSLIAASGGYSVAAHKLLIAVASLAEHRLSDCRLQ